MGRPFVLAQISDLHIKAGGRLSYGIFDAAAMLRTCVAHLLSLKQRPDVVAITGDLTDRGKADEYALLRRLIAPLDMPVYLIPGNHDRRDAMRAAFPEHGYLGQSPDIERHPQVQAILCGHVHRAIQVRFAGTVASSAPSVAHQIPVDLDTEAPSRFAMEPPAHRLHAYSVESGLVSHIAHVGAFAGPYPFIG